jgi:hypothetical protein
MHATSRNTLARCIEDLQREQGRNAHTYFGCGSATSWRRSPGRIARWKARRSGTRRCGFPRGLVERIVITPAAEGVGETIELVGAITRMVALGNKKAAFDSRTACSVKVVAGAYNHRQFALPAILV